VLTLDLGFHAWILWATIAGILVAAELLTLNFSLLMLAGGAGAAALASLVGVGLGWQIAIAATVAVILLAVLRPVLVRRTTRATPETASNVEALLGASAYVLAEVGPRSGLVNLSGETWSARTEDAAVIPVGRTVRVTAIAGATAVVTDAVAAERQVGDTSS